MLLDGRPLHSHQPEKFRIFSAAWWEFLFYFSCFVHSQCISFSCGFSTNDLPANRFDTHFDVSIIIIYCCCFVCHSLKWSNLTRLPLFAYTRHQHHRHHNHCIWFIRVGFEWNAKNTVNAQIFAIEPSKITSFTRRRKTRRQRRWTHWTRTNVKDDRDINYSRVDCSTKISRLQSIFFADQQKKSTRISVRRPSYTKAKEIQFNDEQSVNILSAHFNLLIAINAVTAAAAMVLFSWDSFIVYYLYAI